MKALGKVAVFGGTFSPVHNGHLAAMKAFAETVRPDILYIIPTAIPPHKQRNDLATDAQRLAMLNIAVEELDVPCRVYVSDMEILRGGRSYTADTLFELNKIAEKLYLYCGTDMILTIDEWHKAHLIFKFATVAYMQREEDFRFNEEVEKKVAELSDRFIADIIKIPAVPIEVSSSEVREKIAKGEDISELVPKGVGEYIKREGIYVND